MTRQNFRHTASLMTLTCLAALAFSSSALAQISLSSTTLNFTEPSGSSSSQTINVSTTSSTTLFVNTTNSPTWLRVNPSGTPNVSSTTPLPLVVTANASGLSPSTYTGTFTVAIQNFPATTMTVTVNLTVAGTSLLSSAPTSLSFQAAAGTTESNVPTQNLQISSSGQALNFTVTASTTDGNNWLIPFTTAGTTNGAPNVTVGVNPAGLSANMYSGTIVVQSTTTSDSVSIPVTLTLTSAQSLSVTPTTVQTFLYQTGTVAQTGQLTRTLMVSSSNASTAFTSAVSPTASWLTVNPPSGATGTGGTAVSITLTANPSGLTPGTYTTNLTFGVVGGSSLSPIVVTLVVSSNPLIQLSSNALTFNSNFGATTGPPSQSVNVTTLGTGNTSYSYSSNQSWLTATTSSNTTPAVMTVFANPSGLTVGTYTGTITVVPNNSDQNLYSLPITVTLTIGATSQVTAAPPLLVFSVEPGQNAPGTQLIELQAAGQPVTFSVTTSVTAANNCSTGNWLTATAGASSVSSTAPATIQVGIFTGGLTAGTCSGNVVISYPVNSSNPSTITVPVTVFISATAELTIAFQPGFGVFTAAQGGANQTSNITLGSSDNTTPINFTISATSPPSGWLSISQSSSTAPQTLQLQIIPGTLQANTYSGSITITSPTFPSPVMIPVTLTITSNATVTISGTGSLSFSQSQGGPAPATQTLTISSSGSGASFQTSVPNTAACSWLHVTPSSGAANGSISFIPQTNSLPVGTYPCPVTFSFLGSATTAIVETATLTVGNAQTVAVSPTALSFAYQLGGSTPAAQQLMVTSTGGTVGFTVGTSSTGGWLTTGAASGTLQTPQTIGVSVNPANIPSTATAGSTIQGTITITAPGVLASPISVTVSLSIVAAATPMPSVIFNSATGALGNGISPGELITIKGLSLGPASPAAGTTFTVTAQNTVSSTLAGTQVTFGGIAGTPTYVSATQINVVVPWEIAGRTSATIVVLVNGVPSAGFEEAVVPVAPGIYTLNATGVGQAAALNQNFTINGPTTGVSTAGGTIVTSPAPGGTVIAVYGTGGGLTSPQGVTGTITPTNQLYPLLNWSPGSNVVTATIGGKPATVTFAGAAPGEITGVIQINMVVPTGLSSGNQALMVTIDGVSTQANVTVVSQ